jgi:hypothetical protein
MASSMPPLPHPLRWPALLALGALLLTSAPARAQQQASSTAIDVQQFRPAPGQADVLGLHGPGVPGHLRWRAGLFLHYANAPLVLLNPRSNPLLPALVDTQLNFDVTCAVGLGERLELSLVLPIALRYGPSQPLFPEDDLTRTWLGGLGDLRLIPKAQLLRQGGLRVGLALPVVLPTAGATQFRGQAGVGMQPRLAADYTLERGLRLLANVGVNLRTRQDLLNLSVGDELGFGLGAALPFQVESHRMVGLLSVTGAVGLAALGGTGEEEVPLEVQGAVQWRPMPQVLLTVGAGRGLTQGYGSPAIRLLAGVAWTAEGER